MLVFIFTVLNLSISSQFMFFPKLQDFFFLSSSQPILFFVALGTRDQRMGLFKKKRSLIALIHSLKIRLSIIISRSSLSFDNIFLKLCIHFPRLYYCRNI